MLTSTYTLDLTPGGVLPVIHVSQYDDSGRILVFELQENDGILSLPDGCQAAVCGTKPDGTGFDYDAELSTDDDTVTVTVTVTQQMAAVFGSVICEIYLYVGTTGQSSYKQIATTNFILKVERAALDQDTIQSDSEIRSLINVTESAADILAAAEEAVEVAETAQTLLNSLQEVSVVNNIFVFPYADYPSVVDNIILL